MQQKKYKSNPEKIPSWKGLRCATAMLH